MGITDRKTIELGLGFLKFGKTIGWEMGSGQNLGWENGIYTPPPLQDPPCRNNINIEHTASAVFVGKIAV